MKTKWECKSYGIPDEMFIRGNIPMTKEEIRSVTISKLRVESDDRIIDIGAGTGSISIECGLVAEEGKVYSVERKAEGIKLIQENIKQFNIDNIEVIQGMAPDVISHISKVDKVIIGGSGGRLEDIFSWIKERLKKGGRLVANFITIENLFHTTQLLKKNGFREIEVVQIAVSRGRNIAHLTMMEAENPIYIVSAVKE